jgi:hypothetical protein
MTNYRRLWIGLIILALLSPLGLYLPSVLRAGAAWGEWSLQELHELIGYTPAGMARTAEAWKAPLPEYALPGEEGASLTRQGFWYILSALLGIAACGGGTYFLARWLSHSAR